MEAKKKKDSEPQKAAESKGAKRSRFLGLTTCPLAFLSGIAMRGAKTAVLQRDVLAFVQGLARTVALHEVVRSRDLGKIVTVAQQAGEYIHGRLEQTA